VLHVHRSPQRKESVSRGRSLPVLADVEAVPTGQCSLFESVGWICIGLCPRKLKKANEANNAAVHCSLQRRGPMSSILTPDDVEGADCALQSLADEWCRVAVFEIAG
jgi:hypothetical protein